MNSARLIVLVSTVTTSFLCSCDAGERISPQTMPVTQAGGQAGKEVMSHKLNVKIGQD
jgi:hypothetical protein